MTDRQTVRQTTDRRHSVPKARPIVRSAINIMFKLRTSGKVWHTFLSILPFQTNGTECAQTDEHTKVKTLCPPVSLCSLGGHNNIQQGDWKCRTGKSRTRKCRTKRFLFFAVKLCVLYSDLIIVSASHYISIAGEVLMLRTCRLAHLHACVCVSLCLSVSLSGKCIVAKWLTMYRIRLT